MLNTIIPDFTPEQITDYNDIVMEMLAASESDIDAEPLALEPHVTHPQQIEATEVI